MSLVYLYSLVFCQTTTSSTSNNTPTNHIGGELEVLKSIDFDVLSFGVIFYEIDQFDNHLKNMIIRSFLESKGKREREIEIKSIVYLMNITPKINSISSNNCLSICILLKATYLWKTIGTPFGI